MPGFFKTFREKFSLYRGLDNGERIDIQTYGGGTVASATTITSDITNYIITKTRPFIELSAQDLYEHLFIHEPEVAAVVNKVSEMVASSFKSFTLIDDSEFDNISDSLKDGNYDDSMEESSNKDLRKEMLDTANEMSRSLDISSTAFEVYSTILEIQGEIFIVKNKNHTLTILPNNRITIVDTLERINNGSADPRIAITEENFLVFDEGLPDTQRIYNKGEFVHIKLNDVPVNIEDVKNRHTYGIYGVSPIQRAIIPIWMRRQIYAIEALWRWGNVPREHHIINAEAFKPITYSGTPAQKVAQASAALQNYINSWKATVSKDTPDMKYVTDTNIDIKNIEHSGSSYMESNKLLESLTVEIWDGLGMPPGVIRGKSDGSYASDLIVASGASLRIEQIAKKIGRVVLQNMKDRLLDINPEYPVNHLDIKVKFEFNPSLLDQARTAALYKQIGEYTPTEIRAITGHLPLTEEQLEEMVEAKTRENYTKLPSGQVIEPKNATSDGIQGDKVNYPTTPHSANTQGTTQPDSVTKNTLYPPSDYQD
jgi:hypothetical protein